MITENVFEARFRFVDEMVRLGADARTDGHHAVDPRGDKLSSAPVWASDIRAGAGLVLAGLCADGETEVWDVDAHRPRLPAVRGEPARAGRPTSSGWRPTGR
jgi:UDP-N-acetylglucosamine 1-carboxyvinyltransferase